MARADALWPPACSYDNTGFLNIVFKLEGSIYDNVMSKVGSPARGRADV